MMTTVLEGRQTTIELRTGMVLVVDGGTGIGSITRQVGNGGDPGSPVRYTGARQVFGPYGQHSFFRVIADTGQIVFNTVSGDDGNVIEDAWSLSRGLVRSVVANNCGMPNGAATVTGTQYMGGDVLYCPAGARRMSLVFAGVRIATNVETDLPGASAVNVSYSVVPAPWDSAKAYAVGDNVQWNFTQQSGGYSGNPYYKAVNANTNSMPGPGNVDWTVGDTPVWQQCTLGGQFALGATTVTKTDGTTVARGYFETDEFSPLGADGECYISPRVWVKDGGGLALVSGGGFTAAGFLTSGATTPDTTGGAVVASPGQAGALVTGTIKPVMARGVPAIVDSGKTVAIIGNSIPHGATGNLGLAAASVSSGGSGYTTADVGKIVAIDNTGATATSIGKTAQVIITQVASSPGPVTAVRAYDPGSYASTGQPSGTQGTVAIAGMPATVGTGLTITPTFNNSAPYDGAFNRYYARGYAQRGLSQAGIRWSAFTCPGDTIQGWATRDYTRMSLIQLGRFSSAIINNLINDITGGRSVAQIQADLTLVIRQLRGSGIRGVFVETVIPFPSSTDGYATLANQTAGAQNAVAQQINTWIRTKCGGIADGFIDTAATIEDGGAINPTGKCIVDGTVGYCFIDGKHPAPRVQPVLASVMQSFSSQLL